MSTSTPRFEGDDATLTGNEMFPALPSNPSPLEREIIKQRISLSEKRSSEYSSKIVEAKGLIAQLRDMMARESQERIILQASISPLHRVPREVLSLIFQMFVLDLLCSPWIVAQVSSSFRKVALASSSIWTRIQLSHAEAKPPSSYQNGREICNDISQLRATLSRSNNALLDIEVVGFNTEMAREVVQERGRLGSFHMTNPSYEHALMRWMIEQVQPTVPLESVTLNGFIHHDYLHHFLNLAQPVSLILPNAHDLEGLVSMTWPARLHKLHVSNLQDSFRLPDVLKMTAYQLTSLSLSHIQFKLESMPDFIVFPNLLELSLIEVNGWWKYAAPRVREATLVTQGNLPELMGMAYPSLKTLVFNPQKSEIRPASLFAPALESLTLRHVTLNVGHPFSRVFPSCFQFLSEMRLRQLHIDNCNIQFKDLLDGLRYLKSVEKLCITNTTLPVSFYKAFKTDSLESGGLLFPLLSEMVVDLARCKAVNKETFSEAFCAMVKARKMYTRLTRLSVSWPEKWKIPPTHFV